jgi:trans-2,3-dihydro-3-hydroxyanthranilate isomerase
LGVYEDPATGSAAAAFAGALLRFAPPADGEHDVVIEQGYEMGRPSLITLSVTMRDGRLTGAAIGGDAIAVSEGTIEA